MPGEREAQAAHSCVDQEEAKVLVVVEANAIVDPRTVVVHLHHAAAAD